MDPLGVVQKMALWNGCLESGSKLYGYELNSRKAQGRLVISLERFPEHASGAMPTVVAKWVARSTTSECAFIPYTPALIAKKLEGSLMSDGYICDWGV
jgi:hypothetical protein